VRYLRSVLSSVAVVAAALLIALIGSGGQASAATIPGAITSITTTQTTVSQWDVVHFNCTWAVPAGAAAGDTFTMQLPPKLKWWGSSDFNLTDPAGNIVATAHANANGLVVFTLTDYVKTHPANLHGTCNFSTQYTAVQTQPGPETLEFQVGSQVHRVPVIDAGPCTVNCEPVITKATKIIRWRDQQQTSLRSGISTPKLTAQTNNVTITDTPSAGLALDCSTAVGLVGTHLNTNRSVATPNDSALYPASISCSATLLTATWSGVPAGEYVQIWVTSVVTDMSLQTYTNNGNVTINGSSKPVTAQAVRKSATGTGEGTGTTSPPTPTPTPTPKPTVSPKTPATAPQTAASPAATSQLAFTGSVSAVGLGLVAVLLGSGALLLVIGRRRGVYAA
jgi:hypothetical protein